MKTTFLIPLAFLLLVSTCQIIPIHSDPLRVTASLSGAEGWTKLNQSLRMEVPPRIHGSICPPVENIIPCTCIIWEGNASPYCEGSKVGENTLRDVMEQVSDVNGVNRSTDDWLDLYTFGMGLTNLRVIDLAPLIRTRAIMWSLFGNLRTTDIVGPPLSESAGLIDAQFIWLAHCSLTDKGFNDVLKYFSPTMVYLNLVGNLLTGQKSSPNLIEDDGRGEFLPGLSALSNLWSLNLGGNRIQSLRGGQFRRNTRLTELLLVSNGMRKIGKDAFLFDQPPDDMVSRELWIDLSENHLHQDKIHTKTGIDRVQRPVRWSLSDNKLTSLPQQKFQPFLDAHVQNSMSLYKNPIICDARVKWLQDGRDQYEHRVWTQCVNDPGQTVFNSSLVVLMPTKSK